MARAKGYVVKLPNGRMDAFLACVEEGQRFGEPVPEFQHSRNLALVCFVVNGRNITHVAMGRRGTRSGTGLRRLNLEKAEEFSPPISVKRVCNRLPNRNKTFVKQRFASGGLLPKKSFAAVVEAIRELAPQASVILDRYSGERIARVAKLSAAARQNLAYQKEAVVTALSIADIDRDDLQEWSPPEDGAPDSFLEGLPTARLREDPMVVHDLMNLPGFDILKTYPYNAAVFESESERLTVVLANRLPLEKQTGTDLIYFNETYQSFVMVQYKAMEKEQGEHDVTRSVFRLPNAQLDKEIERMDEMLSELKACGPNTVHTGFRLTENPFFIKLCPRIVFNPDNIGLVPGMYLPLDYWKLLEKHPGIKGPHGGLHVTYENVGRHLDNSAFATVVAKAWVGTTINQSAVLKEVIRQTLETGKAVAIAVKPKPQTPTTNGTNNP